MTIKSFNLQIKLFKNYARSIILKLIERAFFIEGGVRCLSAKLVGLKKKTPRYYKEGRGQGELGNYKPWLTIQDVPSSGRSHRDIGWKTKREHHLLSDIEYNYFCLLDWSDNVIDIREQFPINREIITKIAEDINITHPSEPYHLARTFSPIHQS